MSPHMGLAVQESTENENERGGGANCRSETFKRTQEKDLRSLQETSRRTAGEGAGTGLRERAWYRYKLYDMGNDSSCSLSSMLESDSGGVLNKRLGCGE